MEYIMLVIAVFASAVVAAVCMAMKWNQAWIFLPLVFLTSVATTYFAGPYVARPGQDDEALLTSLGISAGVTALFAIIRLFLGPLDSRRPGPAGKAVAKRF